MQNPGCSNEHISAGLAVLNFANNEDLPPEILSKEPPSALPWPFLYQIKRTKMQKITKQAGIRNLNVDKNL